MWGLSYVYVRANPKAVEKMAVESTVKAFSRALTFEGRKTVYFSLPDILLPDPKFESVVPSRNLDDQEEDDQDYTSVWADLVAQVIGDSGSSFTLMAKTLMRRQLLTEACGLEDFDKRVGAVRDILSEPSIERDVLISTQLEGKLRSEEWIEAKVLEENAPATSSPQLQTKSTCDPLTKLLIYSVAFFPGPIRQLLQFIEHTNEDVQGTNTTPNGKFSSNLVRRASSLFDNQKNNNSGMRKESASSSANALSPTVEYAFLELRELYQELLRTNPQVANFVLQRALSMTIETIEKIDSRQPYRAYVRAIDRDLLDPLRKDANITEDILSEVKNIFLAAPPELQARILLCAMRHPHVTKQAESEEAQERGQAIIVRDLLSAGGVIAVKLAQMLAEDPRVPWLYRKLFGELRNDNSPMSVLEFWQAIPPMIRKQIHSVGPCLGVGSVKQVHRCRFLDGRELAVGVLRRNVENECLASIHALEASDELGVIAERLGRLVFQELNLYGEGEALADFALTRIGRNDKFRVVKVVHKTPKCLVQEIAEGPTLAKALEDQVSGYDQAQVKKLLAEYHEAVFAAFANDGLIHSDIHLGNAVVEHRLGNAKSDGKHAASMDELGLVLFDVGQWEKISHSEAKAILWVMASLTSTERRKTLREAALTCMQQVSAPRVPWDQGFSGAPAESVKNEAVYLKQALEKSYEEAIAPFQDGTIPDHRQAYLLFLRASEKHGVELPKGVFAVAKMIEAMESQREEFRLRDVAEESMEAFLRKHMSWWEAGSVLKGSIGSKLIGN